MRKSTKGTLKLMGMSASQARLLSITARLSDNEFNAQALSYSKQRLADETEQVNKDYIEALKSTKLQVITGFNGSEANYEDISYTTLTGFNTVACDRQYVITNSSGKIVVSQKYANAYEKGNGDANIFLAELGVTQAEAKANITEDSIHEAWDKYFASVYGTAEAYYEQEHGGTEAIQFGYSSQNLFGGYATCQVGDGVAEPINFNGSSDEQRELYDYAVALTTKFYSTGGLYEGTKTLKTADELDSGLIQYYKNILNQMTACGYVVETGDNLRDNALVEDKLTKGEYLLKYYSATDGGFVSTSLSDDDAIQEVEDERKITLAEAKYTSENIRLEAEDNKIDLELKKLDSEHNALQTEYDSVKSVIDKNVEKSFNVFS